MVFAKSYIDAFKFRTVTTGEFRDHFVNFIKERLTAAPEPADEAGEEEPAAKSKKNKKKKKAAAATAPKLQPTASFLAVNMTILKKVDTLDWNALFTTPGMPTYKIDFSNPLSDAATALANKWINSRHSNSLNENHMHFAMKDMDVSSYLRSN